MKNTLLITLLLLFSSTAFSQESQEFEYVFNDSVNPHQNLVFTDIVELSNGNYVLYCEKLYNTQYRICYAYGFLPSGEMYADKQFPIENGYKISQDKMLKENINGDLYFFQTINPIWDTVHPNYVPGIFKSKMLVSKLDQNLNISSTKEYQITIDTTGWHSLSTIYDNYCPFIDINSVIEIDGEGFVVCFEKFVSHNTKHESGHDSTFFWKLDYDGNILFEASIEHSDCNFPGIGDNGSSPYRNHLLYDNIENKYYYYTNLNKGAKILLTVYHLDDSFNVTDEYIMEETLGIGIESFFLDGYHITFKRTSRQTTILGSKIYFNKNLVSQYGTTCMEVDDQLHIVDSINKGVSEYINGKSFTRNPYSQCLDWVDENKIFFGFTPLSYLWYGLYPANRHQIFILSYLDRELNTEKEIYYDKGDNTWLWINTIKATSDGGCMIAGHFWDYSTYRKSDYDNPQGIIKKFPPETFLGIEEAHENGVSVAVAYPNPGKDMLCIRTTVPEAEVEVFDVNGRIVAKRQISDLETLIPSGSWSSGMYLWRVSSKGKVVESGKWVK